MTIAVQSTHKPSMNLRFVERVIPDPSLSIGGPPVGRIVRVLQQMMIPKDWSQHDEFWQDVECIPEPPQ